MFCDEALYRVADRAVQIYGAHGLMKEAGIEKIFRIARNLRIPGGTDEIQRVNIAEALGLSGQGVRFASAGLRCQDRVRRHGARILLFLWGEYIPEFPIPILP